MTVVPEISTVSNANNNNNTFFQSDQEQHIEKFNIDQPPSFQAAFSSKDQSVRLSGFQYSESELPPPAYPTLLKPPIDANNSH